MINETVILLTPFEDCSEHRLSKYISLEVYLPFDLYFYEPLQRIFSKVILYDYTKRMTEIGPKAVNKEIIALVRKERPKYVVWTSSVYEIQESTFAMIRKKGTMVVGYFFDDEWRFDNYSKWWIPYLDYCVTNTVEAVPKYKDLTARVIQTMLNTGTPIYHDLPNTEEKYDVSFVGSRYVDREQYIKELKNRNIPIHLFGAGWGGFIPYEEIINIFRASKINLNFSGTYAEKKKGLKGRIFEVCMNGGFMLTEYVSGIEKYFEINKEIVCFNSAEEMIDKIIYYLNHETERQTIAQAGWKRATHNHTSFHMLSNVFREIEKDIATKDKESKSLLSKSKMPKEIRKRFSDYYFNWGEAVLLENYKCLWKDQLALSIRYYPFNTRAWYLYIVGFLPSFMRPSLIMLYEALGKLRRALLSGLGSIPYLKKMKQILTKRL